LYGEEGKEDNKDMIMLPEELFREIVVIENELEWRIKEATDIEPEVERMIGKDECFQQNDISLITFQGKIYIPPSLRETILIEHHNNILTGHLKVKRT